MRLHRFSYDVLLGGFDSAMTASRAATMMDRVLTERSRNKVPGADSAESQHEPSEDMRALDDGVKAEFGYGLREIGYFMGEAIALAQERASPVVQESEPAFVSRLAEKLEWTEGRVRECLSLLALVPRRRFAEAPQGFTKSDLWPWRFNRALSYLRRPFVVSHGVVSFTPGHVFEASGNLVMLCLLGRLKAKTPQLAAAMGVFTAAASKEFVERVAASLMKRGLRVDVNVKKFGKAWIRSADGLDLGDVDVLAVDLERRRLIALECKNFEADRMPHEVHDDVRVLFEDTNRVSAQTKHMRRVEWLRANMPAVVAHFGGNAVDSDWAVVGGIVLSRALTSPLLRAAKLPIWTIADVNNAQWTP